MEQQLKRKVSIDPITRLEGHGRIEIFFDDNKNVEKAYLQIPELRGFEKFCEGRLPEDMPQITSRICGVCPTAHHIASAKTLDKLFNVESTPTAKKIRELVYNAFMFEDHALHFYILGGPDFIVGTGAPKELRNVIGVIQKVGTDIAKQLISIRKRNRELISYLGGKVIHPVLGLPGGVAKGIDEDELSKIKQLAQDNLEFALFTLDTFKRIILENHEYLNLVTSPAYTHQTYYMGMVDSGNRVNFYDGMIRVVDPNGKEYVKFDPREYRNHIGEHVEPWTYIKFCYLKNVGWKGFKDGIDSGIYCVAPLGRLNACESMATPKAQQAYEEYIKTLGKPVHYTLATHWARIIEIIYASERMIELVNDPEITGKDLRNIPSKVGEIGIAAVEAPRGTLFHHYETDSKGLLRKVNLIVATQNNAGRISLSIDKSAKELMKNGDGSITEELLNKIEMAFRAYDLCFGCATHYLPSKLPFIIILRNSQGKIIKRIF
ncbi:MAG TPA: Ni/Fe hydrogenase subunit alpha [Candidatus Hydrogenedens sp.]|nr:Ni/Fe hydrogenase subunit alpha [Candidatus Hydrogenedens sp.]